MAEAISVRELKARLSHYLGRLQQSERFLVTSRGKNIAEVKPVTSDAIPERLRELAEAGLIDLNPGGMRNLPEPIPLLPGEKTLAGYVRDQRR